MKLLDQPEIDPYGYMTIARFGGWKVVVCEMIFNYRLMLIPEGDPFSVDYGWCYPKGPTAILAVRAWEPDSEGEPVGYIKAVHRIPRQPGDVRLLAERGVS